MEDFKLKIENFALLEIERQKGASALQIAGIGAEQCLSGNALTPNTYCT